MGTKDAGARQSVRHIKWGWRCPEWAAGGEESSGVMCPTSPCWASGTRRAQDAGLTQRPVVSAQPGPAVQGQGRGTHWFPWLQAQCSLCNSELKPEIRSTKSAGSRMLKLTHNYQWNWIILKRKKQTKPLCLLLRSLSPSYSHSYFYCWWDICPYYYLGPEHRAIRINSFLQNSMDVRSTYIFHSIFTDWIFSKVLAYYQNWQSWPEWSFS